MIFNLINLGSWVSLGILTHSSKKNENSNSKNSILFVYSTYWVIKNYTLLFYISYPPKKKKKVYMAPQR